MYLKKIVFIIPLTPDQYMTPLRAVLRRYMLKSLLNLKSNNWTALLLGEEEYLKGNLNFIKISTIAKKDKLYDAYKIINSSTDKPKYIVRMDDDLISSNLEQVIDRYESDCYADE